jgi:hypothetical protein
MGWRDLFGLSINHKGHHVNTTGRGKHSKTPPPPAKNPAKSKSNKTPKKKG